MDYTRTHRSTTQAYATPLTLEGLNYEEECLLFSSMHREAAHTEEDYLARFARSSRLARFARSSRLARFRS